MCDLSARRTQTHSQPRESLLQPLPIKNPCILLTHRGEHGFGSGRVTHLLWLLSGERGRWSFFLTSLLLGTDPVRSSPASAPSAGERRWSSPQSRGGLAMLQTRMGSSRTSVCVLRGANVRSHWPHPTPLFASRLSIPRQWLCLSNGCKLQQGRTTRKGDTSLHHWHKCWLACTRAHGGLPVTSANTQHPQKAAGQSADAKFTCMVGPRRGLETIRVSLHIATGAPALLRSSTDLF